MLISLNIDNYALISHLEFCPTQHFTVITGETGAGKSIIMGALSLVLGQRADAKAIRAGATKCTVEAVFDISSYGLMSFFEENGLEYDATSTIIRREIYITGKSRAFVNDSPVQLSLLKMLGESLIDIHSQHQNLLLGKDSFQLNVVDTLAQNQTLLEEYKRSYQSLIALRNKIKKMKEEAVQNEKDADYIRFQFNKLDEADLKSGEQEPLEEELEMLSHAEEIKAGLCQMRECLDGYGESVVSLMKQMCDKAQSLSHVYPQLLGISERLSSDYIDIKDIAEDISDKAEGVSFDPDRFAWVEERLSTIYSLEKKFDCTSVEQLILLRDELDKKMKHIDNSEEEIAEAEAQEMQLATESRMFADRLTESRKNAAERFEKALSENVSCLGMPNVRFKVDFSQSKDFTHTGLDEIRFMFSANRNQPLKPIAEVASGGEISRLMLSIKALIAKAETLPTIIFDEIDTGVSGDIADRMGEMMKDVSQYLQVITITHLPQVAGKGDAHFRVFKQDREKDTTTSIVRLSDEERVEEIARVLSGSTITAEAINNARILLDS